MEWLSRVNWVDVVFVIIILKSIYVGSQKGFFGESFNILGIVVAIIFAIHFYGQAATLLNTYLLIPINPGNLIAFVLLYAIVFIIFSLILYILKKIMKMELLPGARKTVDKIGGPIIGTCKGIAVSLFVFLVMLLIPIEYITNSAKTNSLSGRYFSKVAEVLYTKTMKIIPDAQPVNIDLILKGASPLRIKAFEFRKKDKLDEIVK